MIILLGDGLSLLVAWLLSRIGEKDNFMLTGLDEVGGEEDNPGTLVKMERTGLSGIIA